jgi:hypothetical protein
MTETTDMQRIKDLQYCLDWLDGEQIDLANGLSAELGPRHPLFQRYCHMATFHRVVTTYVRPTES